MFADERVLLCAVTVGGIAVPDQVFAAVVNESSVFQTDPVDGVFGLAFPSVPSLLRSPSSRNPPLSSSSSMAVQAQHPSNVLLLNR